MWSRQARQGSSKAGPGKGGAALGLWARAGRAGGGCRQTGSGVYRDRPDKSRGGLPWALGAHAMARMMDAEVEYVFGLFKQ